MNTETATGSPIERRRETRPFVRMLIVATCLVALGIAAGFWLTHEDGASGQDRRAEIEKARALESEADRFLFVRSEPAKALELYARAFSLAPFEFAIAHKRAWAALLAHGANERTREAFEQALALAPPSLDRDRYRRAIEALGGERDAWAQAVLETCYRASRPEAEDALR